MPATISGRASLDGPPPAATGVVRRVEEPPMGATLGLGSNPISPTASIEDLLGRAMELEIGARELVTNLPEIAQVAAQFIDALRAALTARVQGGEMQQSPMMAAPANPMAGMGAAPQPAGLGAAPPAM